MAYFKIGENDYSNYVSLLTINKTANFNSQTNAHGDSVVDYINHKRNIEVEIRPLDSDVMIQVLNDIDAFNVKVSYRDPNTGLLAEDVDCIITDYDVDYYNIQSDRVLFNKLKLKFNEL